MSPFLEHDHCTDLQEGRRGTEETKLMSPEATLWHVRTMATYMKLKITKRRP